MLDLHNLKLGVATASAQIEGGEVNSNWNKYSDCGKIIDNSNIKRATDHWNRYEEDIDLLCELGIKEYRMSVEWARIEPENGRFNYEAMERYIEEIKLMKKRGINILLTLHHFSHPQWFEDMGGFEKESNVKIFVRFVKYVIGNVYDLINDYCTINEPNVYATQGYFFGEWLQEEKNLLKTIQVMNVFVACHISCYKFIHEFYKEKGLNKPVVTFALNYRYFEPYSNSVIDKVGAKLLSFLFQEGIFKAFALGEFVFPFRNLMKFPKGKYLDSIGINYYTRGLVKNFQDVTKENTQKTDLGWEIYPDGLSWACKNLYEIIQLPIRITENGTCDNRDEFRCRYIYEHLKVIIDTKLPVTHYYHWCFTDNFEWKEGERPRFGIVHIDYDTQKRTIKNSGYFFKQIIEDKAVSEKTYEKYVSIQKYHHGEINILSDLLSEKELRNRR